MLLIVNVFVNVIRIFSWERKIMLLKSLPGRSRAGYLNIIVIVIANPIKIFSWENKGSHQLKKAEFYENFS